MKKEVKKSPIESSEYQVFSEIDLNKHGNVSSYLPAWAYPQLIEDLENEIREGEIVIKSANISQDAIQNLKNNVKEKKARLDEIIESRPKVDKDKINAMSNELGEKISESLFTRDQMMKGTADAHEEAKRMSQPCIKLTPEQKSFAMACNIRPRDGMVSRNEASKMWKVTRKLLGESSMIEDLRR